MNPLTTSPICLLAVATLVLLCTGAVHAQPSERTRSVVLRPSAESERGSPPLTKRAIRHVMRQPPVQQNGARSNGRRPTLGHLKRGGAGGALLGAIVGGGLGALLAVRPYSEDASSSFSLVGGLAGLSLGAPLGVHLANERRGNYALGALASAGVGLAGTTLTLRSLDALEYETGSGGGFITAIIANAAASIMTAAVMGGATIAGQIGTSIVVERLTAP